MEQYGITFDDDAFQLMTLRVRKSSLSRDLFNKIFFPAPRVTRREKGGETMLSLSFRIIENFNQLPKRPVLKHVQPNHEVD